MAEKAPPTYDEMKSERAKEWASAQALAGANLAEQQKAIVQMPDVMQAPTLDMIWSHQGIACPCGGEKFQVTRWTTCNGLRHRTELLCRTCQGVRTWDFGEKLWLD